jgi:nitrogen regulatory protein PII
MANESKTVDIELICFIINFGSGSKLIKKAKQFGIPGGTVSLGRGTINNRILDFIGLSDVRKEIVFMVADKEIAYNALEELDKEFQFNKPNHGIAYTTTISSTVGTRCFETEQNKNSKNDDSDDDDDNNSKSDDSENDNIIRGVDKTMYQEITVIVDKGKAEDVIDAATKAGSKGGTILNARGSGIHETSKVFSMEIEPEKEIIMILSEVEMTDSIVSSITDYLKIDEPGNGIIYIRDVNKTYGIYK